eukprot:2434358-Alexandrium_andersonii.AAC.1
MASTTAMRRSCRMARRTTGHTTTCQVGEGWGSGRPPAGQRCSRGSRPDRSAPRWSHDPPQPK